MTYEGIHIHHLLSIKSENTLSKQSAKPLRFDAFFYLLLALDNQYNSATINTVKQVSPPMCLLDTLNFVRLFIQSYSQFKGILCPFKLHVTPLVSRRQRLTTLLPTAGVFLCALQNVVSRQLLGWFKGSKILKKHPSISRVFLCNRHQTLYTS